jgi:8-oxo-dGTP diphosphatase
MVATVSIPVAVGVLMNSQKQVLLTQRTANSDFAGHWEFPGGKVNLDESVFDALVREFKEELGIAVQSASHLINVSWAYSHKRIVLHVFCIDAYEGIPRGAEAQALAWVDKDRLSSLIMPPADFPIISAIKLPRMYAITPDWVSTIDELFHVLNQAIIGGARMVQIRIKSKISTVSKADIEAVVAWCRERQIIVLVNSDTYAVTDIVADGIQLTSATLRLCSERPLPRGLWLGASCHSASDIHHAASIGCDFVTLSPVLATASHPNAPSLGWEGLARIAENSPLPIFALGGMNADLLAVARNYSAFGVSGIRGFCDCSLTLP